MAASCWQTLISGRILIGFVWSPSGSRTLVFCFVWFFLFNCAPSVRELTPGGRVTSWTVVWIESPVALKVSPGVKHLQPQLSPCFGIWLTDGPASEIPCRKQELRYWILNRTQKPRIEKKISYQPPFLVAEAVPDHAVPSSTSVYPSEEKELPRPWAGGRWLLKTEYSRNWAAPYSNPVPQDLFGEETCFPPVDCLASKSWNAFGSVCSSVKQNPAVSVGFAPSPSLRNISAPQGRCLHCQRKTI